jgi:signal transduction histidine kinase
MAHDSYLQDDKSSQKMLGIQFYQLAAFISVVLGYLLSIISANHLNLFGFMAITILNVLWLALMQWGRVDKLNCLVIMIIISWLSLLTAHLGTNYDWLIGVVTLGVIATALPLHQASIVGGIETLGTLLITTTVSVSPLNFMMNASQLLSGYIFVFIFSAVARQLEIQRDRSQLLVQELEAAQEQLRLSAKQSEELAIARERNRMAREIHDTLGHYLTLLTVQLETAHLLEERGDPSLKTELTEAQRVVRQCLAEVRHSVAALRPNAATVGTFDTVLHQLAHEYESTIPGIEITLDLEGPTQELTPEERTTLYRCIQESFTNIRKHAQATKVLLRLRIDNEQTELTVIDNGIDGKNVTMNGSGFGLMGMSERVALLGGTLIAGSNPQQGWRVNATIPRATLIQPISMEVAK